MPPDPFTRYVGRGSSLAPANRFETVRQEADWEQLAADDELLADERRMPTVFLPDHAATLIRENDSPDVSLSLQHQSLSRLRARLCLLLCSARRTKRWE